MVNRGEATTIATAVDASASIRQNGCVRAAWLRLDQGNGVHISLDSIWRLGGSTLALPWVDLAWRVLFGVYFTRRIETWRMFARRLFPHNP